MQSCSRCGAIGPRSGGFWQAGSLARGKIIGQPCRGKSCKRSASAGLRNGAVVADPGKERTWLAACKFRAILVSSGRKAGLDTDSQQSRGLGGAEASAARSSYADGRVGGRGRRQSEGFQAVSLELVQVQRVHRSPLFQALSFASTASSVFPSPKWEGVRRIAAGRVWPTG